VNWLVLKFEVIENMSGYLVSELPDPERKLDAWFKAVELGNTEFVIEQLQCGMNVDVERNRTRTTALMVAVRNCQVEMVRLLLEYGANLSLENTLGHTAMTYAVIFSRTWECYWRVSRPDSQPLELLLAAGGCYRLREAVLLNDLELARTRLDEGECVDTGEGTYEGSLLQIAAGIGYLEIVDLLLDRGANIEAMDDLGQRPLLWAARAGQVEVVQRLLDRGAELNAEDWFGCNALWHATDKGHQDLVELLEAAGSRRSVNVQRGKNRKS